MQKLKNRKIQLKTARKILEKILLKLIGVSKEEMKILGVGEVVVQS